MVRWLRFSRGTRSRGTATLPASVKSLRKRHGLALGGAVSAIFFITPPVWPDGTAVMEEERGFYRVDESGLHFISAMDSRRNMALRLYW